MAELDHFYEGETTEEEIASIKSMQLVKIATFSGPF